MKGTVKVVVAGKNYGFITGEDGKEHFFHREDFRGHWEDLEADFKDRIKMEVTFETKGTPKGPRASEVKRTEWPNEGS